MKKKQLYSWVSVFFSFLLLINYLKNLVRTLNSSFLFRFLLYDLSHSPNFFKNCIINQLEKNIFWNHDGWFKPSFWNEFNDSMRFFQYLFVVLCLFSIFCVYNIFFFIIWVGYKFINFFIFFLSSKECKSS